MGIASRPQQRRKEANRDRPERYRIRLTRCANDEWVGLKPRWLGVERTDRATAPPVSTERLELDRDSADTGAREYEFTLDWVSRHIPIHMGYCRHRLADE